jgi:hypothetical protein
MSEKSWAWRPPPGLNVEVCPTYGCWRWLGALNNKGYAEPQRRIWMQVMGIVLPTDVHLDHFCRRRFCINSRHLDPVSTSENQRRRSRRYRRTLTRCPMDHRLMPENTLVTPEDGRVCRLCLEMP